MPASDWLKAAITAFALTSLPAAAQKEADILIRHVTVVDVGQGRAIPDQAVVTSGNDIVAVGSDATIAKSWKAAQTLDARGRYIIPGLWDMHVHFGGGVELIDENKVLLERNPLADIGATRSIHAVILRGKLYDRAALDKMLAETKAKVAAWNAQQ